MIFKILSAIAVLSEIISIYSRDTIVDMYRTNNKIKELKKKDSSDPEIKKLASNMIGEGCIIMFMQLCDLVFIVSVILFYWPLSIKLAAATVLGMSFLKTYVYRYHLDESWVTKYYYIDNIITIAIYMYIVITVLGAK